MTTKKNVKKITDFSIRQAPVKKKKEVPVSEQADAIDVAQEWFIRNWKLAVAAAVLIAIVIAAVVIVRHVVSLADQKARAEIASASTITSLTEVLEKYAGNPASIGAAQRLASLYLAEKDYENARKALKFVIDFEKADPYIRTRAAIDSAGILEIEGSREAACGELRSIAADPGADEVLRAEAAFSAARIAFEAGEWSRAEEALALINTARAETESADPYSAWAADALALKAKIEAAKSKQKNGVEKVVETGKAEVKKAVETGKTEAKKVVETGKAEAKKAAKSVEKTVETGKAEAKKAAKSVEKTVEAGKAGLVPSAASK